ncbi:MAG TPA: methyl-accepting chemotaxis protein [Terriglobales bacterium]|jgi:methyl-accepting chemotaxis protein|nr:methyl-accepting chemotaxis protein [Terriglobales bacterium]
MNIGKKLYLSFGGILLTVVILAVVVLFAVWHAHDTKAAAQHSMDMTQATSAVRFEMMQNRLHLQNYLLSGDTRDVEKMNEGIRRLGDALHRAQTLVSNDQQRPNLDKVQQLEQGWSNEFANPLAEKRRQVDSGNATVAELQIFYLQKDPGSWVSRSSEVLDQVDQLNLKLLDERRSSDEWAATFTIVVTVVLALAALGVGIVIAYRTSKGITEPLNRLIHVARQIGDTGDLEHTIDLKGEDEIGQLARSFDSMVKYLKEMASVSEAVAGGNLTIDVQPRSPNDTLGNAKVRMLEGLRGLVRNVRDAASQVASASSQVAGASDESAKNSLQTSSAIDEVTSTMHEMSVNVQNMVKSTQVQASSVSETSASIDQMVTSIQRVADTAKVLLDISNRSREEVHSGIGTMEKATDGLNRINTTIRSSGEIIDALGSRADNIGKIVEVIDDLAEQTNLLALNAAIEAARAGEHGLGFAVVADEVRKLAEKSAQSTKEISELIQSIQKEARRAVDNMEKSTSIVNEGLNLGQELNGALRKISNVVTEVYKFAQEIGAATNEQSHGSSQIARATTRLNEITHEINSAVEEQASGAQAVVKAMERMRELVQSSTSGSTELAASAEQMSKMSRNLLGSMDTFALRPAELGSAHRAARQAAAGGH